MKTMKKIWNHLPKLPRGLRVLCNFLLGLLLIPIIWAMLDYPLSREMQFRRMERANLMPESEIVYQDEEGNVVGVRGNTVVCGSIRGANPGDWEYRRYEIGEEPVPIPLAAPYMNYYVGDEEHNRILIFNAPEDADRVELEIDTEYVDPYTLKISSDVVAGPGLLRLKFGFDDSLHTNLSDVLANGNTRYPYRLRFYQGDVMIGEWEENLPVGVPNKWQGNSPSY